MVLAGFVGDFGWFWMVLGGFGWFWVVPCFSNYGYKNGWICRRKLQSGPIRLHEMFIDSSIDLLICVECVPHCITSLACNVPIFSSPLRG